MNSRKETPEVPFVVTVIVAPPDTVDSESVHITVETRRQPDGRYKCEPVGWGVTLVGYGDTIATAEQEFKRRLREDGLSSSDLGIIAQLFSQHVLAEVHEYMDGSQQRGYQRGAEELRRLSLLLRGFAREEAKEPAEPSPSSDRDTLLLAAEALWRLDHRRYGERCERLCEELRHLVNDMDELEKWDKELAGARKYRAQIESRLAAERCVDSSDAELERCLGPCVLGPKMVEYAKALRVVGELEIPMMQAEPVSEES